MDIGKSFSYVFEDKKWIEKILIGGLIMLIPILGPLLMFGYGIQLVRNVRNYAPEPLPEWDDWGTKIVEGLKLAIIYFLWGLPLIILSFFVLIPATFMGNSGNDVNAIATIFALCFGCFAILYAIIVSLATPGITIKFAESGDFSAGLKFGEILGFTKMHLGQIIIVIIVMWFVSLIAGIIGFLLCFVGLLFTMFWASLVQYHMIAQIGLEPQAPEHPLETLSSVEAAAVLPETSASDATDDASLPDSE